MTEKRSQTKAIIEHLRKYKQITSIEAFTLYGATRLSSIIFVLRNRGFEIRTEEKFCKNRFGTTSNYAVYYLEKDIEELWVLKKF